MANLVELTNKLSTTFEACLGNILSTSTQQEEQRLQQNNKKAPQDLDTQITNLKATFHEIERGINDIRLKALSTKEVSAIESNKLLREDIDIKRKAIEKYITKIERWEEELPIILKNARKALALRTDGQDFDATHVAIPPPATDLEPSATNDNATSSPSSSDHQQAATATAETTSSVPADQQSSAKAEETVEEATATHMDVDDDEDDDDDDVEFEEV
ncbi:hypothetical protein BDF20DRAFT_832101 [Mycotypha africana]|uniref:uncharacterized protein n=1 Tax=Mycotypha africana TaxID=64632 RepID=UPI0023004330|nr:uncharacterized protein BDF20DRAFT_832101 [Mycotypha africana]KAI8992119.1 hypothetical protein BDF20DRAFT_832101 [Mycotypha africana]